MNQWLLTVLTFLMRAETYNVVARRRDSLFKGVLY